MLNADHSVFEVDTIDASDDEDTEESRKDKNSPLTAKKKYHEGTPDQLEY